MGKNRAPRPQSPSPGGRRPGKLHAADLKEKKMMLGARSLGICGFAFVLAACGSDPSSPTSKSSPPSGPKTEEPTGQATEGYTRVIEGTWTLAPGKENPNFCVKKA